MRAVGKYYVLEKGDEILPSHFSRYCGYLPDKIQMFDRDGNPMTFGRRLKVEKGCMLRTDGKLYMVEEVKKDTKRSISLLLKVREYKA